jgi:hypothetical protein
MEEIRTENGKRSGDNSIWGFYELYDVIPPCEIPHPRSLQQNLYNLGNVDLVLIC